MNYVYIHSEKSGSKICKDLPMYPDNYFEHDLFTVGFYTPDGKWEPESDHSTRDEAAKRCNYLNGGLHNATT